MIKANLIRMIAERCRAQQEGEASGRSSPAVRSPAAGGGLAGASIPPGAKRRTTARHPQTGHGVTLRRRRLRAARRG